MWPPLSIMEIRYSDETAEAIRNGRGVVALESTVIAHGLPYPKNLETAIACEAAVRAEGCTPSTIAMIDGQFCAGLNGDEIERFATASGIRKISRRDLAIGVGLGLTCATTVATTSFIAHRAGVRVFATGGIGGVHRGFSADVSADLPELAQTPIVVVCSGAKVILDLPVTREWLETSGVTVLGWRCDEFPAFYSRSSGLAVDERVDEPSEVVDIVRARDELGLPGAILLTVPVPAEYEMDREEVESIVNSSVANAGDQGIKGKELTPFLLSEMSSASAGRTLAANIALLENNARVAAVVARELSR